MAVGYEIAVSEPKTKRGRRVIELDPQTITILRAHRRQQVAEKLAAGPVYRDDDLVFAQENGAPLHPDRVSKMFDRHVAQSGLRRIRLHDLRHTLATLALKAGVNPKVVSERLGHASVSFTLERYSHVTPGMQAGAAARVAALLGGES